MWLLLLLLLFCSPVKSAGKRHLSLETRHGQPGKYLQVFFVDSYLPTTAKVKLFSFPPWYSFPLSLSLFFSSILSLSLPHSLSFFPLLVWTEKCMLCSTLTAGMDSMISKYFYCVKHFFVGKSLVHALPVIVTVSMMLRAYMFNFCK